ncbi:alpha-glucosidase-like [Chelonus insularis]|uniref:alpha-glucosidase-like n=1 Tax=Chelonus insularis TaxID=460826 RepID=UPI00158A2550|nr:alpha-glucosidase-like [Chelonus insularis]
MLRTSVFLCLILQVLGKYLAFPDTQAATDEWWRNTFVYQIYPRSFKDSNGDGVGDLIGITNKLEHLADLNISALWLSPIYTSPMVDFGYDIANFTDIDPTFGTLSDFTKLVSKAKSLGLKVVLDFVPNHSSDKHVWFQKSVQRIKPYDEYYVWKDAKIINGTRHPPNNWLSIFQGSAWQWNEQRKQYYLHQFAVGQPDLNYRSAALNEEMKNVLRFWLNRGVDGFRIDTIPNLVEDARFLDEPKIPNTGLPDTDPGTLRHIYTADQNETYDVLKSWRAVLDATGGSKKIFLTEAYTSMNYLMKYYQYGSNVPFNFMYIATLNNRSSALDFKFTMDQYLNNIPPGFSANWVVGNHDNHRVAWRFGEKRADQLTMIASVMPGIGVLYNGDEIGMIDRPMSWKETVDPAGCNAGPSRYNITSRDPARTPFQWDSTTSAGFSTSNKTWLPVHSNYKTLNLAAQKMDALSHYSVTKKLIALKRNPVVQNGSTQIILVGENVLGVVRRLPGLSPVVLLINFSDKPSTVDAAAWMNIPEKLNVYAGSVGSNIKPNTVMSTHPITLPGAASVVLV